jgi:hypothetical protein
MAQPYGSLLPVTGIALPVTFYHLYAVGQSNYFKMLLEYFNVMSESTETRGDIHC